jgi:hypothetical protein
MARLMKKIVIGANSRGCSFSRETMRLYAIERPPPNERWSIYDVPRDDPLLIRIIESITLKKAGTVLAELKIVEIPDDVHEWEIVEYRDGEEYVAEKQRRTWE